jgi:hypothetical protein
MLLSSIYVCTQITECYCLCHITEKHIQKMCGKLFFLNMASSNRTTDILVGQIHLADVDGIPRENRGDGGDLEDETGRSEVGVGGVEHGGNDGTQRARRRTTWTRWCPLQPPCERLQPPCSAARGRLPLSSARSLRRAGTPPRSTRSRHRCRRLALGLRSWCDWPTALRTSTAECRLWDGVGVREMRHRPWWLGG